MNAITVCVEYDDLLQITLPHNRRHFDRYLIVTSPHDKRTIEIAALNNCTVYGTDAFYRDGAIFNKGLAMEEGFDILGRQSGWMCILDADIVLPLGFYEYLGALNEDCLYVPRRRMMNPIVAEDIDGGWSQYPINMEHDLAGYCQIFNTGSRWLNRRPWYGTKWKHAGGCDSEFEALFPRYDKYRIESFNVLHLGPDGKNWCGRVTERLDNSPNPLAEEREKIRASMLDVRQPKYKGERLED